VPTFAPGAGSGEAPGSIYSLPGMECLVNGTGVRVKALVIERGVRPLDRVPGGVLSGPPLRYFHPYFVFDVHPAEGEPRYYRLGSTPRRESIVGWAPASAVARWDSRVGVRYARREGQRVPPLLVYEDKAPLLELLAGETPSAKPIARARLDAGRAFMPWPVAETERVTLDGRVFEVVRLNFLAEVPAEAELSEPSEALPSSGEVHYTAEEVNRFRSQVRMLDIVFCVDNTHSTGPFLDAIRGAVEEIAQRLHELPVRPDLRFGLVLYRDYVDGLMYDDGGAPSVVRSYPLEGDLERFLARVRPLRAAEVGSDGAAEAGYDGLAHAVTRTRWRGDALSARAIVLIGDNSFHEPGAERNPDGIGLETIEREARARRIPVFGLCIEGAGDDEEQALHRRQFEDIASATGGASYRIDQADRVLGRIRDIAETRTALVADRDLVLGSAAEGKSSDEIAAEHRMDVRQVTEVMEFLEGAGIDLEKLGPGVPTYATGWALVEVQGAQILEREVYLARSELDILLSGLHMLKTLLRGDGSRESLESIFQLGLGSRLEGNPLAGFFRGTAAEPLDVYLMAKGIPVGRSSILRLSEADVRHMSQDEREVLHSRISRRIVPALTNAGNDDSLWGYRDELEFGWVLEELLP